LTMRKIMKKSIIYLLPLFIAGCLLACASAPPINECMDADWYEIGFNDGSEGEPRYKFQEYIAKCEKYQIYVGREAYFRGRDQGLKIFCAKDAGNLYEPNVRKDKSICPHDLK
jgi:hypothetical protein